MIYEIKNDYHKTSVCIHLLRDDLERVDEVMLEATEGQRKKIKRKLCGIKGCKCSSLWKLVR